MRTLLAILLIPIALASQPSIVDYNETACPGQEITVTFAGTPGQDFWFSMWTKDWDQHYAYSWPEDEADTITLTYHVPDFFAGSCWISTHDGMKPLPVKLECATVTGIQDVTGDLPLPLYTNLFGETVSPVPGQMLIEHRGHIRRKVLFRE